MVYKCPKPLEVWAIQKISFSPCTLRILYPCFGFSVFSWCTHNTSILWAVEGARLTWQANGYHRCTQLPTVRQTHTLPCEIAWSIKYTFLVSARVG
jgi:hypothetical protein